VPPSAAPVVCGLPVAAGELELPQLVVVLIDVLTVTNT